MEESAKARGTGIAKRSPEYIIKKIDEGKAVIAVTADGTWVGFCYIEAWEHGKYVANSALSLPQHSEKQGWLLRSNAAYSVFPAKNILIPRYSVLRPD